MAKTDQTDSRTSKGKPQPTGKTGRPTLYTAELAAAICDRIADGANLNQLAQKDAFPSRQSVYKWMREHPAFADNYARAREARADSRADKIDQICRDVEDGRMDPTAAKVIIEALQVAIR